MAIDNGNWWAEERRRTLRFERELHVSCRAAGSESGPSEAESWDVSLGGMSIKSQTDFPVGSQVVLSFGSESEGIQVRIQGTVKRSTAQGESGPYTIGIQFSETDRAQRASIVSLAPGLPWGSGGWQNRGYVRLSCALPLRFKRGVLGRWHDATTDDLSTGGLKFRTKSALRAGERVGLMLQIGGEPIRLAGVVVDREQDDEALAVSVSFISPSEAACGAIAQYITRSLEASGGSEDG